MDALRIRPWVASVGPMPDGGYRVELESDAASSRVLEVLVSAGVTSITTSRPSLEEVYIRVIGNRDPEDMGQRSARD